MDTTNARVVLLELWLNSKYPHWHSPPPADFNAEHEKCLDFIKRSVAESTAERIVVVTHHLPTMAVVAPEHKGNLLNSTFATELDDFIADSRIDAWIFGH